MSHKNLYLLRLRDNEELSRTHDIATGFIVRATSSRQARKFASDCCGDEGPEIWINTQTSTCNILTPESAGLGVVMRDFRAG